MLKILVRMMLTSILVYAGYAWVFSTYIEPTIETVKTELNSAVINPILELEKISGGDWPE